MELKSLEPPSPAGPPPGDHRDGPVPPIAAPGQPGPAPRPRRRRHRAGRGGLHRVLVAVMGFVLASLLIYRASDAAFTSSTSNAGNTWTVAGVIFLTDDDSGQAAFS